MHHCTMHRHSTTRNELNYRIKVSITIRQETYEFNKDTIVKKLIYHAKDLRNISWKQLHSARKEVSIWSSYPDMLF